MQRLIRFMDPDVSDRISGDLKSVVEDVARMRQNYGTVGKVSKVYLNYIDFGEDVLEVEVSIRHRENADKM